MSRSGYSDYCDHYGTANLWCGAVASAIRGRRGQAFLREMAAAMDAMPQKVLTADRLVDEHGDACAIGTVCLSRGMSRDDIEAIDYEDPESVAKAMGIAKAMAAEIEYENDEGGWHETYEQRWQRMRRWIDRQIAKGTP